MDPWQHCILGFWGSCQFKKKKKSFFPASVNDFSVRRLESSVKLTLFLCWNADIIFQHLTFEVDKTVSCKHYIRPVIRIMRDICFKKVKRTGPSLQARPAKGPSSLKKVWKESCKYYITFKWLKALSYQKILIWVNLDCTWSADLYSLK